MGSESTYVTIDTASSITNKSHDEIVQFCESGKIRYGKNDSGEYLPDIKQLISVFGLNDKDINNIPYCNPNSVSEEFPSRGIQTEGKQNEMSAVRVLHHDDAPLFPPLRKKVLLEQKTEEMLPSPVVEELLPPPVEDVLPVFHGEENPEVLLPASTVVEMKEENQNQPETPPSLSQESPSEKEAPIFNVAPNFIDTTIARQEKEEPKGPPQNPRPIIATKFVPVPHLPIQQPIPSLHPLNQPPTVIPFATPAPAAHTKIAAVYTQPFAKVSDWMPWMRTSQWLKRAVQKATAHPHISHTHSGLPATLSSDSVQAIKVSTPIQTPVSVPDVKPAPLSSVVPTPPPPKPSQLYKDEPAAIVSRMNIPVAPKDALDTAFFGAYQDPVEVVPAKETLHLIVDNPVPIGNPPVVEDSWDALMFGGK